MAEPEPWMRGHHAGLNPVLAAVLYALEQAGEDLFRQISALTEEQIWHSIGDIPPFGFHALHIAGSIDRLLTYAAGEALSDGQLETLKAEQRRDVTSGELLELLKRSLESAATQVRNTDPANFGQTRYLGRKRIPTTLAGLLIHTAEHTQRHVGAAIVTAKLARNSTG